ncbi:RtcB family protein [Pendulispora albinea]|uniref:3'-phosphate/5'-hydroxy nucleic acid ligase n=1 Tax=Pendulispora albinea TaxID=2741071 RepID=A0ABZ2LXY3_9BACT
MSRIVFEPERGQRVPVRIWARALGEATLRQLQHIASQPYVVEHVAAMADAHVAEGVAVGTVFATEHTVVPRALGGDLGCGMSAVRLGARSDSLDRRALERVITQLGKAIPTGDSTHRGRGVPVPDPLLAEPLSTRALEHTREALTRRHLGTLGGGNHFLELERDPEGYLWVLVHSGSRGLGAAIAAHHARAAEAVPPATDEASARGALAGLDTRTEHGAAYLRDLTWALAFARANRAALLARALDVLSDTSHASHGAGEPLVDIHHNFVARERWFGRELLVHRKGAVSVPSGTMALIPGSMGTASYIVEGLGHEAAFGSCSHGAGRVMSRKEARARIRAPAFARSMRRVVYPKHLEAGLVEEAPAAYRDIVEVLDDQGDLVRRVLRLEPVAVLKG